MLLQTCIVSCAKIQRCQYSKYTKTDKRLLKRISVLGQDTEKFAEHKLPRSKPTDRRIYAWGFAATGALGILQSLKQQAKKQSHVIKHPARQSFAERRQVIDCASGYGFSLFACQREKDNISLFGTGLNTDSQIGFHKLGGLTNKPMEEMIYPAPIFLPKVNDDEEIQIVKCAAGRAHSVVLSNAGVMYTMGNNAFGQCGRAIIENEQFAASQMIHRIDGNILSEGAKVNDIRCGQDHTLVLLDDGKVLSCGWGADGQTGLGHFNSVDALTRVGGDILNEKIVKVSSNADCVLALNGTVEVAEACTLFHTIIINRFFLLFCSDKGEVFGWGNSEYDQLEIIDDVQQLHTPIYLKAPSKCGKIIDIATGGSYCLILNGKTSQKSHKESSECLICVQSYSNRKSRCFCLGTRNSRNWSASSVCERANDYTNGTIREK